mmetsp:Transcript_66572/g.150306  ORF Transcript_66572/g.150306 Transcript_66572/m.150306 type:complete len:109 (-) Transcript_66572:731-1057(-)
MPTWLAAMRACWLKFKGCSMKTTSFDQGARRVTQRTLGVPRAFMPRCRSFDKGYCTWKTSEECWSSRKRFWQASSIKRQRTARKAILSSFSSERNLGDFNTRGPGWTQ